MYDDGDDDDVKAARVDGKNLKNKVCTSGPAGGQVLL